MSTNSWSAPTNTSNLPKYETTRTMLNTMVDSNMKTRLSSPNAASAHDLNMQTSSPWLTQEINTQTSSSLLPTANMPKPGFNILQNPGQQSPMSGIMGGGSALGQSLHAHRAMKLAKMNWEERMKYEIRRSKSNPKKLQAEIMRVNVKEAALRDQRDVQAKKLYKFATIEYMLAPELANVFGELSKNQANVSNYQEALLNRIDARTYQELDLLPDMVEQLITQLNVYCKAKKEFDKELQKVRLGQTSGSWLNFFQPTPQPRYPFGAGMFGAGHGAGLGFAMQGGMMPPSPFMSPEKAPSELHVLAKKCKDALTDLENLYERYWMAVFSHYKKALQMQAKAYLEYHTSCVEIYTKEWNDIEKFDATKSCQTLMSSMGINDLKTEIEGHISSTSNDAIYKHQMQMFGGGPQFAHHHSMMNHMTQTPYMHAQTSNPSLAQLNSNPSSWQNSPSNNNNINNNLNPLFNNNQCGMNNYK